MGPTNIVYYTTIRKENIIKEFLESLEIIPRAKVRRNFLLIREYGFFSLPNIKKIKETPLWEIRILGKDNIRVFCIIVQDIVLILHGFIKKSQKTPQKEIIIAVNRYSDWKKLNVLDK